LYSKSAGLHASATLSLFTKLAGGDSDAPTFVAGMFAILGVLYLVVARQTVGYTLGEAVLDVRYQPPRRPRFQRLARQGATGSVVKEAERAARARKWFSDSVGRCDQTADSAG
jgi:hypothetical protein